VLLITTAGTTVHVGTAVHFVVGEATQVGEGTITVVGEGTQVGIDWMRVVGTTVQVGMAIVVGIAVHFGSWHGSPALLFIPHVPGVQLPEF
jgi:uncharacterized protein (DUF39 family)